MFPFHTPVFAFLSVMVDPCLVLSNNASEGSVTSFMIAVRRLLADCQTVALLLSCEFFWNPSCTNFMKHKLVMDDSMSRTMTDASLHL
jgi:hypothetical protein